ncbi:MAG: peptidoglycan-binding protein [Proteobacteria bacterium]|nr:peptidoglycan-binding protein [Pseudomonadota bacterium]
MVSFVYLKLGKIYRVEEGICILICDLKEFPVFQSNLHTIVSVAVGQGNQLYICRHHDILLIDLALKTTLSLYSTQNNNVFLRDIAYRKYNGEHNLYFSTSGGNGTTIYMIQNGVAVVYHSYNKNQLTMPDPCNPGGPDIATGLEPGVFAFDMGTTLFVSNGNSIPCCYYKYSDAGDSGVTGQLTRLHVSQINSCWGFDCIDSNYLYSLTGKDTDSTYVEISEIHLTLPQTSEKTVFSQANFPDFDKRVVAISLDWEPLGFSSIYAIKWLQTALNKTFPQAVPLTVDGKFGPKTRSTLKLFQASHQLLVDGKYGAKVKVKIIELLKVL